MSAYKVYNLQSHHIFRRSLAEILRFGTETGQQRHLNAIADIHPIVLNCHLQCDVDFSVSCSHRERR